MMPYGWEGNRRSGVALATRHRLQWFIHLQAYGLRKGDEHPNNTPVRSMALLYLYHIHTPLITNQGRISYTDCTYTVVLSPHELHLDRCVVSGKYKIILV